MGTGTDTQYGGRIYDWWSRHTKALDLLYQMAFLGREKEFRRLAIDTLNLAPGESILEIGCGTGNSFEALRRAVGPDGTVVGIDASRGMTHAARDRIRKKGWQNVHVLRGDARRPPVPDGAYHAAYAAMSLSAVADPEQAIKLIETTLRAGGRFIVLDAQPFQHFPWTLLNPIITPLAETTTNWMPQVDLLSALRRGFRTVDVETFHAGSILVACARKSDR